MSGNTCSYDCSVALQTTPSYTDISGIGVRQYRFPFKRPSANLLVKVIVSYVVTAFFVVVITTLYYLFAHQPNLYPFQKRDDTEDHITPLRYRSNPIDKIILSSLAKWPLRKPEGHGPYSRLEKALIKGSQSILVKTRY